MVHLEMCNNWAHFRLNLISEKFPFKRRIFVVDSIALLLEPAASYEAGFLPLWALATGRLIAQQLGHSTAGLPSTLINTAREVNLSDLGSWVPRSVANFKFWIFQVFQDSGLSGKNFFVTGTLGRGPGLQERISTFDHFRSLERSI